MGSKSHRVKGSVGKTIGNTQDGSKGKLRRSKAKVRRSSVKETIKEVADRDCRQDPQDGPRPVAQGRAEFVARPTDRAIGRDPASMAGAVRGPPNLSSLAQPTSGRRGRPQGRAKADRQTSSDDNTSSPACGRCRPNVARSGHGSGGTFGNGSA